MTEEIIVKNWLDRARDDVAATFDAEHLALVYDQNTYEVIAQKLIDCLAPHYKITTIDLGRQPRAMVETSMDIRRQLVESECHAMIAVGSGTINDLCKYAAYRAEIPYAICATAPSMNGYTSATSSLFRNKRKYSLQAQPARAVFADLNLLCEAPRRLLRAGLGDALCRTTVQADWLMSHLLLDTEYEAWVFDKMLPLEDELLSQSQQVTHKDPTFVNLLMRILNLGGRAMAEIGTSAPSSQGEHLIAHAYELFYGSESSAGSFHGEQIGVTTMTMVQIQDKMLLRKPKIRPMNASMDKFIRLFGREEGEAMYHSYQLKAFDAAKAEAVQARVDKDWDDIKHRVEAVRLPKARLENALKTANCPTRHNEINWVRERYEHAVTNAHLIRDRFTFLDLAAMDMTLRFSV